MKIEASNLPEGAGNVIAAFYIARLEDLQASIGSPNFLKVMAV